jgi:hypothetical protein
MIGDGKSLVLSQTFFQTPYNLVGAPQCESNRILGSSWSGRMPIAYFFDTSAWAVKRVA